MAKGRDLRVLLVVLCCSLSSLTADATKRPHLPKCAAVTSPQVPPQSNVLPTSITFRPLAQDWLLDFTIQGAKEKTPSVCITLLPTQQTEQKVVPGHCQHHRTVDFETLKPKYVMNQDWITVHVTHGNLLIKLKVEGSDEDSLDVHSGSLPKDAFLKVSHSKSLEVALGCDNNCPAIQGSKANTTFLTTIKTLPNTLETFFFWPGEDFVRLNLEIQCQTSHGSEARLVPTDLTQKDMEELKRWHKIDLDYDDEKDVFKVIVNGQTVKNVSSSGLEVCNVFRGFSITAAGETFFSFTCDPSPRVGRYMHYKTSASRPEPHTVEKHKYVLVFLVVMVTVMGLMVAAYHRPQTPMYSQVQKHGH